MIRLAKYDDLPEIMLIYEGARRFMKRSGNPNQWINGYPLEEIIRSDIDNSNFYIEEFEGVVTGCFAFIIGQEPTYLHIEGQWIDERPYGTIHRLASSGIMGGVADRCFAFCQTLLPSLRADTHEDNIVMQRLLLRNGFRYCGIIHVANGTPRLAYQLPG